MVGFLSHFGYCFMKVLDILKMYHVMFVDIFIVAVTWTKLGVEKCLEIKGNHTVAIIRSF